MRDDFKVTEYIQNERELINIVFNDKLQDISIILLNEDFLLATYYEKEQFQKVNKSTNIFIAVFTTAHARLKLYDILDILGERVCYFDTDSTIYIDDESEACKKIDSKLGCMLGQLTNELGKNHMDVHVSTGPKDYSHMLDDGSIKGKCKGFRVSAETDEKMTHENRVNLLKNKCGPQTINSRKFVIQKNGDILVKDEQKEWDFEFNKRMIVHVSENHIDTIPFGY